MSGQDHGVPQLLRFPEGPQFIPTVDRETEAFRYKGPGLGLKNHAVKWYLSLDSQVDWRFSKPVDEHIVRLDIFVKKVEVGDASLLLLVDGNFTQLALTGVRTSFRATLTPGGATNFIQIFPTARSTYFYSVQLATCGP
jgi:hypothetical protein